ncbi:MAG: glycerophosphoryl diester phosphodiesterase [Alphaproteobacteria bacterium]|jgi:glycerophosphoryl diester phosphodiesterase|nr:glycerophosphoryl diester phosphodiesterase [Alphaproteobacteria bacterium]
MSLKLAKVIGHRGAAAYAPENTLEGIHTAADMGVEWVELDVKLTKDDVPIIFHDEELDRTTNGSGLVAETTYEEIKQLETGSWFSEGFTGIKIPTLEEALDVLIERDLGLNLEIKPCPGREKETAEIALDILSQCWDDHNRLLISSFQHVSMEVARDMATDWSRGLLIGGDDMPENWQDLAKYLDVQTINLGSRIATHDIVDIIHDMGLKTLIYTVNDPNEARQYQSWGVDAMFSDEPDVILENLLTVH